MSAQVAGRWKISLERGPGSTTMGELRLETPANQVRGQLLLENSDSAWVSLSDGRIDSAGLMSFVVKLPQPVHFEGRLAGDELAGTASDQRGRFRWRGVLLREDDEYYAAPPRFRQRQLVIPADILYRIPGKWIAAASRAGETPAAARRRYQDIAVRSGVSPLPAESLGTAGLYRAMGLLNRKETVSASIRTLEQIRTVLGADSSIRKFDYLFRPQGTWLVDIHDVALARARRPFPGLGWESARPALAAAGLLDSTLAGVEIIPLAVYRLFVLSESDTAVFNATRLRIKSGDAVSAAAVASLLQGYAEASQWYVAAIRFLMEQQWIGDHAARRSPADLVRAFWGEPAPLPEIQVKLFGYPEGAERVGSDSGLFNLIFTPENAPAQDWLRRHGAPALVTAAHRLRPVHDDRTVFQLGTAVYAVSSLGEYAASSYGGFLEARDAILLDPSYQPLMALGTLVHEWQHLLHEHRRQSTLRGSGFRLEGGQVLVWPLDPFLAEGLAEWLTEVALAPAYQEYPFLAFGEAEKRVCLPDDNPHNLGYLMVRTLAGTLGDPLATVALLVRAGTTPEEVLRDHRVATAWGRFPGADRVFPRRGGPVLIPQVTFTVEDGEPGLVEFRIIGSP
ncbi:MAG: hypothetical protein ABI679_00010 [Gemmatimonadota bacterium]